MAISKTKMDDSRRMKIFRVLGNSSLKLLLDINQLKPSLNADKQKLKQDFYNLIHKAPHDEQRILFVAMAINGHHLADPMFDLMIRNGWTGSNLAEYIRENDLDPPSRFIQHLKALLFNKN